ncbi:ATP-binding protein [Rhizobium pusense]|uniref:ATP-binding protein n=1 Tax=Agrobacterium pusense TaxID=648995 RepID=A0A6H0ZMW6_9HYPH|nr:ATP-binding protein [Agrobacterium pusense]MDH2092555.1 ATP-binding protein [Agrobacterium pusense]QIX22108.1 ATP-binding protein [Agrobacterium pusense]WCK23993.1 ATP-binding protein [Agrobacterium pusense]
MSDVRLQKEAVLRVGEVSGVTGRRILVTVDKDKNLSELFYDGDLLRSIAVGSYIDIRKGFVSLIGKVEGENANPDTSRFDDGEPVVRGRRVLSVALVGFIDRRGRFYGGTKELPLVGNEAFLLTRERVLQVHNLIAEDGIALHIATSEYEGYDIALPVDGLMNSHIAIFGNTGSGKSNTLATLYQHFVTELRAINQQRFDDNCRIILLDFNGEYAHTDCIANDKTVYNLSTRVNGGDKVPLGNTGLLDLEMLSIISDATEKTQKPFLRRVLSRYDAVMGGNDPIEHLRNIVRQQITQILGMSDKVRADLLFDYLRQVLPEQDQNGVTVELASDLEWHNMTAQYKSGQEYLRNNLPAIQNTLVYGHVANLEFEDDIIADFVTFSYVQLIYDVLANRAQNEHIAPVINKLRSKQNDIRKVFNPAIQGDVFASNVVVVNLNDVNLEMKKTIPLLLCRRIYQEHKTSFQGKTLNIVVDEAHNILSTESSRETESWKDYRLETFEEIIKEGRKFGVFVTIASQRPNDISPTITSQAHNYFIHRLINQKDLQSIASAVSYIDKLTEESIPTLPTGTCIFSGMAGQMPLKLNIKCLEHSLQPKSTTLRFASLLSQN